MLRKHKIADKVAVIDLDVHHGDGNANMLATKPYCFVLNMFGEKKLPPKSSESNLDIALEDHTGDSEYLRLLEQVYLSLLVSSLTSFFIKQE